MRKGKLTSNTQRDVKWRKETFPQGGCGEQTQDHQKASLGKEQEQVPCKGMSSPSLEGMLAREGPWSAAQGGGPEVSSPMGSGLCLEGTRGSFQLQLPRQQPKRVGTAHQHSPKDHRSQNLLPQSVPEHRWQNLPESCSCTTCPLARPRVRGRETCRTKRKQHLLASGKQR